MWLLQGEPQEQEQLVNSSSQITSLGAEKDMHSIV